MKYKINIKDKNRYKKYKTPQWKRLRENYLNNHPLCVNFEKCHNFAEDVDHITRIENEHDPLFYDENNLQGLCKSCHARKTAREDGGFGNKKSKDKK